MSLGHCRTQKDSPSATASFVPPIERPWVQQRDQPGVLPILSQTRSRTRMAVIRAVVSFPPTTLIMPDGETST